jgi:hypothetical protein
MASPRNAIGPGITIALDVQRERSKMDMLEQHSMEWIRRASDYRTLVGKRDQLGFPLGAVEAARLDALERFFAESLYPARLAFNMREQQRVPISIVVMFAGQNDGGLGCARDISGEGLFVETDSPLCVGTRTVISVMDRDTQEEWRFGAEVVRVEAGGMGLRFVGIPLIMRIGHRAAPVRSRPMKRAA